MIRRILLRPAGALGLVLLLLFGALALFAGVLFPGDPLDPRAAPLVPPFADAMVPLGSDRAGRDILAGIAHGAAASGAIALAAAIGAIGIGASVGALAGTARGLVDEALMRLTDLVQTVPPFLLALALVAVLGPSTSSVVLAIALVSWTVTARIVRAEVMSLSARPFVLAAKALGVPPGRVLWRHVAPHLAGPVLVLATQVAGASMLIEAALSFLGLGDPNLVSWGGMIAAGRPVFRVAPWVSAMPGVAIVLAVLGITLLGEALTAALDPRRRG